MEYEIDKQHDKSVYQLVKEFKKKYPGTIAWRLKSHCKVIDKHLNPGEKVLYAFTGQRNNNWYDIITTGVFAITNKRLLIASDRVVFGYFLFSITPDMFNDLTVHSGMIFGNVIIDTINEKVYVTNLSKDALDEIESNVTEYMMREKRKYAREKQA